MQIQLDTPIGPLTLVSGDGRRISEVCFRCADEDDGLSPSETVRVSRPVQELVACFHEYFSERRGIPISDEALDLARCTKFQRRVYQAACTVSLGETISYGELAARIDCPGGARAVGQALGENPFLVVIPCHRILAADMGLGGYSGGLHIKSALLAFERGVSWQGIMPNSGDLV